MMAGGMNERRRAVCDPEAFYPLRSLVEGPFRRRAALGPLERFMRGVVLHDAMTMEFDPNQYDPDTEAEAREREPGARNVIVAYGPVLTGYEGVVSGPPIGVGERVVPNVPLAPAMLDIAARFSNAGPGNVYYEAHVEYLQLTLSAVLGGGSAVCEGEEWKAVEEVTSFPLEQLFAKLDGEMADYASGADYIGPAIPPVVGIVLTRTANRDRICDVLADLRDEWADARSKVWAIVDAMKHAQTLKELNDLRRQLDSAAAYFSPTPTSDAPRPVRVMANILAETAKEAVTAYTSGGDARLGAMVGAVRASLGAAASALPDSFDAITRRGAFDLARRVRHGVMQTEPMPGLLSRFLTTAEK